MPTTTLPPPTIADTSSITIPTPDNLTLTAWHILPQHPLAPTVLYLHGNAGTLAGRVEKIRTLSESGFGVLALAYRGYSGNPGSPSEKGLYTDARAAIAWLNQRGVPREQIILYGESLGSGVATQMASEGNCRILALEAPFTSVADRALELYPFLPGKFMVRDTFDNLAKIPQAHCPVLIMHGLLDTVIPLRHGKTLYEAASEPKTFIEFPDAGHNDIPAFRILEEITRMEALH